MSFRLCRLSIVLLLSAAIVGDACSLLDRAAAQSPGSRPAIPRTLPPAGLQISSDDRSALEHALNDFAKHKAALVAISAKDRVKGRDSDLVDALIFEKAVRYALDLGEFYRPEDVAKASELLKIGQQRLDELAHGKTGWADARGLVVRGYRSRIDDSVQPYGLVIPETLDLNSPVPLYVWLHGRNERGTDLHFIAERIKSKGEFAPDDAIVLHPFGRFCNAFKFAGEIDVFETIESVKQRYKIDERRIVLMGFSMGGAGVWHLGAHYPDHWVAMSPGAGFVDTRRFQHLTGERLGPWYEQKLWGLYDVPACTRNLFNLPVVSYSGEIDGQKASADIMEEQFAAHGKKLERVIGAKMGHKYDQASKEVILQRMQSELERRREPIPLEVTLQTQTLRYNRAYWIEALALERHWTDSRIDARRTPLLGGDWRVEVTTTNVSAFRVRPDAERSGAKTALAGPVIIDGDRVDLPPAGGFWKRVNGHWRAERGMTDDQKSLVKRHGLQGPIDDAFFEPFLFVRPTGTSPNAEVQQWVKFELDHQMERWKALFRGEVRVKDDKDVTEEDRRHYHLVLWGDPTSNHVLAGLADKLPLHWTADAIEVRGSENAKHSAKSNVLAMIYPNPLNPTKYVVLNSGPTFREADDRSNALQTPKLPDWAVIDVTVPPDGKSPGKIVEAGFFDEQWQHQPCDQGQRTTEEK